MLNSNHPKIFSSQSQVLTVMPFIHMDYSLFSRWFSLQETYLFFSTISFLDIFTKSFKCLHSCLSNLSLIFSTTRAFSACCCHFQAACLLDAIHPHLTPLTRLTLILVPHWISNMSLHIDIKNINICSSATMLEGMDGCPKSLHFFLWFYFRKSKAKEFGRAIESATQSISGGGKLAHPYCLLSGSKSFI